MLSFVNLLMWFVFFDGAYSKVGGDVVCDVQPSNYTREECITFVKFTTSFLKIYWRKELDADLSLPRASDVVPRAWNLMTKPFRPENRDGPTTPVVLKKDTASATFQNCEVGTTYLSPGIHCVFGRASSG